MKRTFTTLLVSALATASVLVSGCSAGSGDTNALRPGGAIAQPIIPPGNFTQVERLGRPAINEGLIITNDFLNAFNSIQPSADLSEAAAPVVTEAANTLTAVRQVGIDFGFTPPTVAQVATGFLPDVMRIDTTNNFTPAQSAYNGDFVLVNGDSPMLTGGRKLTDDVIDITLSYLIAFDPTGATVGDSVPYTRPAAGPGSTNPAIGHQPLSPTFPYLAPAN